MLLCNHWNRLQYLQAPLDDLVLNSLTAAAVAASAAAAAAAAAVVVVVARIGVDTAENEPTFEPMGRAGLVSRRLFPSPAAKTLERN